MKPLLNYLSLFFLTQANLIFFHYCFCLMTDNAPTPSLSQVAAASNLPEGPSKFGRRHPASIQDLRSARTLITDQERGSSVQVWSVASATQTTTKTEEPYPVSSPPPA